MNTEDKIKLAIFEKIIKTMAKAVEEYGKEGATSYMEGYIKTSIEEIKNKSD